MPETPTTFLEVGQRVGESYQVVRLIGRGGMGEVWLAKHLRLPGKQVAVKVLHTRAGGLSDEALGRFKREAEVATRIGHPNIVEVHDYNTLASGAPYLVLEFLQGESLASRLRFGAMTIDEVTPLIRQVGSALDASHQAGVVHRDLKPDNIFLVPTPMGTQVKVLDFGISKVVDSSTLHTADEVLVGTPQYMSPEQATGQNKDVGPQTDVFALGSIAYEMLTGAPPFVADSVAKVVFRIAYEPHLPLQQVKPGLPERVYAAVERALEKDRAKRFATIADFIDAFSGSPVPRTLPPPSSSAEPSGVARPGMATPDSMAWGKTSVHTPAPVAAPPPVAPQPEPVPRAGALRFVALGMALCAAAGAAWFLTRPPPPVVTNVPEPVLAVVPQPAPQPAPPPPPVAVVAEPPKPVAPPVVKSAPAKLPDEDLAVLAEMKRALSEKQAVRLTQQKLPQLKSEAAVQRAYVIIGTAACQERDLSVAVAYLRKLDERAERLELIAECKKLEMELIE